MIVIEFICGDIHTTNKDIREFVSEKA